MPVWISPALWAEQVGDSPSSGVDGVDALAEAVASDPRRLVAIVGGSARDTAWALACRAPVAWYLDPGYSGAPGDAAEALEERLAAAGAIEGRPIVVLDGPEPGRALAVVRELARARLHSRLVVIAPCDANWASRLSRLAGDYPRRSILVAVAGEPTARATPPESRARQRNRSVSASHEIRSRARVLLAAGEIDAALNACRQAVALEESAGDRAGVLAAKGLEVHVAIAGGDLAHGAALQKEVAEGLLGLGDAASAAEALTLLAEIEMIALRYGAAWVALERSLGIWRAIDELDREATCHERLGHLGNRRADPAAAAEHYEAAVHRLQSLDAPAERIERVMAELDTARAAAAGAGRLCVEDAGAAAAELDRDVVSADSLARPRS